MANRRISLPNFNPGHDLPYFTIFLYFHLFISKHFETYLCTIRIIFVFVFVFVVILKTNIIRIRIRLILKSEYYSYSYSFDFEKRILFVFVFVWFWKTNIICIRIRLILKNEYYSYSYLVQNYYSSHHWCRWRMCMKSVWCLGSPVTLEIVFGVTHGSTVWP